MRTEKKVLGLVGPGWRPVVRFMHGQLLIDDPDYRLVELKAKDGELKVYAGTKRTRISVRDASAMKGCSRSTSLKDGSRSR